MKVLISSYTPHGKSSYGIMTRLVWTELLKKGGYDVVQHGWFDGQNKLNIPWQVIPTKKNIYDNTISPVASDKFGAESFESIVAKFRPDIVWCLSDLYMSSYIDKYKKKYKYRIVRWTLSESENINTDFAPNVINSDECVFMTELAAKAWKKITNKDYPVIGYPIDTQIFTPVNAERKAVLRSEASGGVIKPEDTVLLYVGANQRRKHPWLPFAVTAALKQIVKQDIWLWMHSPKKADAYDYDKLQRLYGLQGRVITTPGLSNDNGPAYEDMHEVYNISDMLLALSGAEGFCAPLAEAAACNIPAVTVNYSGQGEVGRVLNHILIPYHSIQPAEISCAGIAVPEHKVAISKIADWIHRGKPPIANHRDLVLKTYDKDIVVDRWDTILKSVYNKEKENYIGELI